MLLSHLELSGVPVKTVLDLSSRNRNTVSYRTVHTAAPRRHQLYLPPPPILSSSSLLLGYFFLLSSFSLHLYINHCPHLSSLVLSNLSLIN